MHAAVQKPIAGFFPRRKARGAERRVALSDNYSRALHTCYTHASKRSTHNQFAARRMPLGLSLSLVHITMRKRNEVKGGFMYGLLAP